MEITIGIRGRSPTPRVINVKQYSSKADVVTFALGEVFSNKAVCTVVGEEYRQSIELKGGKAVWEIAGAFTQKRGSFGIQLEVTDGETVWKSDVMLLIVSESTGGSRSTESGGYGVISDCIDLSDGFVDEGITGYIKPIIQESSVTLYRGGSYQFTVQKGASAVWSVSGNTDAGTIISENGLLTVGENESSTALIVTATSFDGTSNDSVNVAVDMSKVVFVMPAMTDNTTVVDGNTYIASASSIFNNNTQPYRAFDQTGSYGDYECWHSTNASPSWLQLQLPYSISIKRFTMRNRSTSDMVIKSFKLQGSNDGSTWIDLGDYVFSDAAAAGLVKSFDVSYEYTGGFNYYRWYCISASYLNFMVISEITFDEAFKEG